MTTLQLLQSMTQQTFAFLTNANQVNLAVREETITETVLLTARLADDQRTTVYKATQKEESLWGLDWLWAIERPNSWLTLWVQAKKGYPGDRVKYDRLTDNESLAQGSRLIAYALQRGAVPIYAFYNFDADPFTPYRTEVTLGGCCRSPLVRCVATANPPWAECSHGHPSGMGITIADAVDVVFRSVISDDGDAHSAEAVNEYAAPLECLLCPNGMVGVGFDDYAAHGVPTPPDDDDPGGPGHAFPGFPRHARTLVPALRSIAAINASLTADEESRLADVPTDLPVGVTREPPSWMGDVLEGRRPFSGPVTPAIFVITRLLGDDNE